MSEGKTEGRDVNEKNVLAAILRRIDQRQKVLKPGGKESGRLSDRQTSLMAGMSADYLRTVRRQHAAGTQESITTQVVERLAKALKTTPEWLQHNVGPEEIKDAAKAGKSIELVCRWTRASDGKGRYFVEERIGDNAPQRWGPFPSEGSAEATITERRNSVEKVLADNFVPARTKP